MKIFANLYLQITRRELPVDNKIPFYWNWDNKNATELETRVGLLLYFQSHEGKRYKTGLLKTMLHRAYALTVAFNEEWQSYALFSAELIIRNWPRKFLH